MKFIIVLSALVLLGGCSGMQYAFAPSQTPQQFRASVLEGRMTPSQPTVSTVSRESQYGQPTGRTWTTVQER